MPNYFAIANGGFNNPAIWSLTPTGAGGAGIPIAGDSAISNTRTVTISADATCSWILNDTTGGATAGGSYAITDGVTLTANVSASTVICLSYSGLTSAAVVGNIFGGINQGILGAINNISTLVINGNIRGGTGGNAHGVANGGTGTIIVNGNVTGGPGPGNARGIQNSAGGTMIINGNVTGSTGSICGGFTGGGNLTINGLVSGGSGSGSIGVDYTGIFGVCTVNGNVIGGTGSSIGLRMLGSSRVIINGNTFAGPNSAIAAEGVSNQGTGIIIINGNVVAGPGNAANGANNTTSGTLIINGITRGNDWGLNSSNVAGPAFGVVGSQTGLTIVRSLCCGSRGQWPTSGPVFVLPLSSSTIVMETSAFNDVAFISSLSGNIIPISSNVRSGVRYNMGDMTGTLFIPSISSVQLNQLVDNTIGVTLLQPQDTWNYNLSSTIITTSIGEKLKNIATTSVVNNIISSFK